MPNPSPFGANSFGVTSPGLDYTDPALANNSTMTYMGTCIVAAGNIVGRIQSWNPEGAYNRDGEHVYELSKVTIGLPIDYVPGKSTGFTVSYAKTEAWGQEFELALGFGSVFQTLSDQTRPFTIQEYLFKGVDPYRVFQLSGCWLKTKNPEAWTADGNYVYKISGSIAYVSRIRVL
jgi:hypothetical protein